MKQNIKKLLPSYVIALVASFMLLLYEPINMYATNTNDFWFDLYIILKPTLLLFAAGFAALVAFYTLVYFIEKAFSKKLYVYKTIVTLSFIGFIILYIHGNFLIGNLPPLDGSTIDWGAYKTETIISIAVCLVSLIAVIFATLKFKYDKTIKIYTFITLTVFVMLTTSLVSVLAKPDAIREKDNIVFSTTNYMNEVSKDKNFFIFVVDAVDSQLFEKALNGSKYKDLFDDFTYYPDTLGAYGFTRDAIPYILSGVWNENEMSFKDYYNNALNESKLLNTLQKNKYDINIYEGDFAWTNGNVKNVKNAVAVDKKINSKEYIKQLAKFVLFKYLPQPVKKYSHIDTMEFNLCKVTEGFDAFGWFNTWFYGLIKDVPLEKVDQKVFNFTHVEGGHPPFQNDEELNEIEPTLATDEKAGEAYNTKLVSMMKLIDTYIQRLKDNAVYDNSVIIIMSDHGYNFADVLGRQNPLLLVKGLNEKHDNMIKSDKPVSYEDLQEIYMDLLKDKTSEELLPNVDYNRTRRFLQNVFNHEEHMTEYEQAGKAWNWDTMKETGRVFDLDEKKMEGTE